MLGSSKSKFAFAFALVLVPMLVVACTGTQTAPEPTTFRGIQVPRDEPANLYSIPGIQVINADGSGFQQLTYLYETNSPKWSPDGTKIVFTAEPYPDQTCGLRQIRTEIYTMNADGSDVQQLTHNHDADSYPSWSPDGSKIIFVSTRDGDWDVNWDIYTMNADGSDVQQLTDNDDSEYEPSWSPDGSKIVFASDRENGPGPGYTLVIYTMNADGSDLQRLAEGHDPSWSPDGNTIVFEHIGIHTIDADGSDLQRLAHGDNPSWSPDGNKIVFEQGDEIYTMNADGSNVQQITRAHQNADSNFLYSPDWSPDGSKIVFSSYLPDPNSAPNPCG